MTPRPGWRDPPHVLVCYAGGAQDNYGPTRVDWAGVCVCGPGQSSGVGREDGVEQMGRLLPPGTFQRVQR